MAQEVSFPRAALVNTGLFSVACDGLNKELVRRAQGLAQRLLARVQQDAQVSHLCRFALPRTDLRFVFLCCLGLPV